MSAHWSLDCKPSRMQDSLKIEPNYKLAEDHVRNSGDRCKNVTGL